MGNEETKGDVLHVIGDWNVKVGNEETKGTTGRFELGERNERGDRLGEFCRLNGFLITNTSFKLHARRLHTWISLDKTTRNQMRSSVRRVTTLPGADSGTDHNLNAMIITDVKSN